jgi:hypothetical protein
MDAPNSSETSVLTSATWRNIAEDAILHRTEKFVLARRDVENSFSLLFKYRKVFIADVAYLWMMQLV